MTRPQHPLALLRALTGDTQLSYAELVADTHEALGFGKLYKRREKVSRWETQEIPPDYTTQLAIAHIHQVPEGEVQRLGWPHWLHLGTAAPPRAARQRTREETIDAIRDKERPTVHPARSQFTGPALASFIRKTLATVASPLPPAHGSHRITPDTITLIEDRSNTLYKLVSTVNPVTLYRVARAEFGLTTFLTNSGYDHTTGTKLLLATSRIAHLCGLIAKGLGENIRAEQHYSAAVGAAARAGSRLTVSVCLADLAWSHIDAGAPREVLSLIEAARTITPDPPSRLAVVLHSREARAHAQLGEIIASAKALDHATSALANSTLDEATSLYTNIDNEWVSIAAARAWLDAGQTKRALEQFTTTTLLDDKPRSGVSIQPPLLVARDLLTVIDVQLALRDVEAAVHSARRAVSLFDRTPTGLINQYRRKFISHADAPAVQDLMEFLTETPAI